MELSHTFGRPLPVAQCNTAQDVRKLAERVVGLKRSGLPQSIYEKQYVQLSARIRELTTSLDSARTERDDFKNQLEALKIEFGLDRMDVAPSVPKIYEIQCVVSSYFNIHRRHLISIRRTHPLVRHRQIAMYLCKVLTGQSLPMIGSMFGGRDHTTVMHAIWKIEEERKKDPELEATLGKITTIIVERMEAKRAKAS